MNADFLMRKYTSTAESGPCLVGSYGVFGERKIGEGFMNPITRRAFHGVTLRLLGGSLLLRRAAFAQLSTVEAQPFIAQVKRLLQALAAVGAPLRDEDIALLHTAFAKADDSEAVEMVQLILDRHVLLNIRVNPESRISVNR